MKADRTGGRALAVMALVGASLGLVACRGGGSSPRRPSPAVSTGLSGLASRQGAEEPAPTSGGSPNGIEPAVDVQSVLSKMDSRGTPAKPAPAKPAASDPKSSAPVASAKPKPDPEAEPELETIVSVGERREPDGEAPIPPGFRPPLAPPMPGERVVVNTAPPPPEPLEAQIRKTSVSLVDLLRRQSLESRAPFQSYVGLAMLEAIQPGAMQKIIDGRTTSGTPLSPEEQRVVEALQSFARGAGELPGFTSSSEMFKRLASMSASVERTLQMRIHAAALASRVLSFGRYAPLPRAMFVQGRSPRFLVYCEIEHFASQSLSEADALRLSQQSGSGVDPGDRVRVEVSQELVLYSGEGAMVWNQPEQSVSETSRNVRRDFFLTNDVTLPATLSIGKYSLKVIMRDKISGVQDEVAIPLEIVADTGFANVGP